MIVLAVTCRAPQHETPAARTAGCVCPDEWGKPYRPPAKSQEWRRRYVPGRQHNKKGPHRTTVTEPDWVAVERALAGDRTLVLAKADRDDAMDRVDRNGASARDVAIRLGLSARTVQRRRAERAQARR
ncbi:hypothetical protein [Micromonospora humida]|uniref:hypothetical protein n=1 Tax=Micromonospora humida TaxID=2809018 RepID=UPI0034157FA1